MVRDFTYQDELLTTGVLLAPLTRNSISTNADWTHSFTERLSGSLQAVFDVARYSAPVEGAGASNYHYYAVLFRHHIRLPSKNYVTLALTDSLYHADEIYNRSNSNELELAWEHHFDERGVVSLAAGEFESKTHIRQP